MTHILLGVISLADLGTYLDRYAELTVRVGLNLQPGQTLMISGSTEAVDFIRRVTRKAYEAGAGRVHVTWSDPDVTRLTMELASDEGLAAAPVHTGRWFEELAEQGAAFLSISAPNPDLMAGIDPKRISVSSRCQQQAMQGYSRATSAGKVSWCVVAVPTAGWAAKLFPELSPEEGIAKLWGYVLDATRASADDPVGAWREHLDRLGERKSYLNQRRFKKLYFTAPGTDLTVELSDLHQWVCVSGTTNAKGVAFAPNVPSEEVFTAPQRTGVNGVVRSTLPLNYGGTMIEGITLRFDNGRIVEYSATAGEEALKGIIETDEGAHYLGEVALVPVESPIYQTGILFHNTLFDENASCHLAIGRAYPLCIQGGSEMSAEELAAHGVNQSLTHIDFMIGSEEMNIDAETATGERVAVFRNGSWAL